MLTNIAGSDAERLGEREKLVRPNFSLRDFTIHHDTGTAV